MAPKPALFIVTGIIVTLCILLTGHTKPHHQLKSLYESHRTLKAQARRSQFTKVVCFGDSLSDAGNGAWVFTNKTWPKDPAYVGHRFTNGPVYSEYIAQQLMLPLVSYATGGASISHRVSSMSGEHGMLPVDCIIDQIAKYSVGKEDESSTLFIIYAGANDAYFSVIGEKGSGPDLVVNDLDEAVRDLMKIGGKTFIVPTLPPIGENYPYANALPDAAPLMLSFSTGLRKFLFQWAKKTPGVAIADFYTLFNNLMNHPEDHGFDPTKLKTGCIKERCEHWQQYVWFDDYHPTTYVHHLMANESLRALDALDHGKFFKWM
ncbi:hypothetical protein MNV49_006855 [Pseudohyphozyma bogoriensis]|nr:hypothetical protein MNV49_006855 [Pseudohyphozyma bogoriensis]